MMSGSKNLAWTLKTHENISLHPISTIPPKGKIDSFFYIINKNGVFQV